MKYGLAMAVVLAVFLEAYGQALEFRPLFNGVDLSGWVDVNTSPETWRVEDSMIICTGMPIGVMRTDRQYENFIVEIEWRHMEAGGNSGMFIWSEGTQFAPDKPLTKAMEVQMLELEYLWVKTALLRPDSILPLELKSSCWMRKDNL